jgi:tetrapyrrole methylase family protein / MazG family protein
MRRILDILLPNVCLVCSRPIRGTAPVCHQCLPLQRTCTSTCEFCDTPTLDQCNACIQFPLDYRIRYLWEYGGAARSFVHAMKYRPSAALCRYAGRQLAAHLSDFLGAATWDVLIPLPSSKISFAKRLFNQCTAISQGLALPDVRLELSLLRHVGRNRPQATLHHDQRLHSVEHVFRLRRDVSDLRVLLLDDVITTGSTTWAAARALLEGGASAVDVIALARAPAWQRFRERTWKLYGEGARTTVVFVRGAGDYSAARDFNGDQVTMATGDGVVFEKLVEIIAKLRDPVGGCPWDLQQTHQSLKPYVLEEAYEVADAIDEGPDALRKELGDLLLQVVLHSRVAADSGTFTIAEVIEGLSEKLVRRHPHVFGTTVAETPQDVVGTWEQIKEEERGGREGVLDGVPRGMPALMRAQRISEKAARVGFEWPTLEEIRDKVLEEVREFAQESVDPSASKLRVEDEFGDVLFSLIQLARRLDFDAEQLLHRSTEKFIRRFKRVEQLVAPRAVREVELGELDRYWELAKAEERSSKER